MNGQLQDWRRRARWVMWLIRPQKDLKLAWLRFSFTVWIEDIITLIFSIYSSGGVVMMILIMLLHFICFLHHISLRHHLISPMSPYSLLLLFWYLLLPIMRILRILDLVASEFERKLQPKSRIVFLVIFFFVIIGCWLVVLMSVYVLGCSIFTSSSALVFSGILIILNFLLLDYQCLEELISGLYRLDLAYYVWVIYDFIYG